MEVNKPITRKHLESLSKDKLVRVVRDMDAYLCESVTANDQMSWRGTPENTQRHYTRMTAFNEAAIELRRLC